MQRLQYKHNDVNNHFSQHINNVPLCVEKCYTLENDPDFNINNVKPVKRYKKDILDNYYMTVKSNRLSKHLLRDYQYNNKGFLRFVLKDNDSETITTILNKISNITVSYIHGGTTIYTINLLLNFILMREYGLNITIIDVEQFLSLNTDEEIDGLICRKNDDGNNVVNCKYVFNDKDKYYLDIPLLEEFYSYGRDMPSLIWHSVEYGIKIDDLTLCDTIMLGFEESITKDGDIDYSNRDYFKHDDKYNSNSTIIDTTNHYQLSLILNTYMTNIIIENNHHIERQLYIDRCKFIFIVVHKIINMPNLIKVSYDNDINIIIPMDNIILYDFNDYIVYGISSNANCDMHSWTQIKTENIDHNNKYFTFNNVDRLSLTFDNIIESINVNIIYIIQNSQGFISGMTNLSY
jgi:hypothetical protein